MKRLIAYILMIILIVLGLTVYGLITYNKHYINEVNALKQHETELVAENKLLWDQVKRLEVQLKPEGSNITTESLIDDLIKHPELIPYEGVLGGTMGFQSSDDITVLNSRWVKADFDDGHIAGSMLLEYEVSNNKEISWKVINSFLH